MEEKILALYSCGMSQRDIAEQIKNLYDVEISPELVSKIRLYNKCWGVTNRVCEKGAKK
jgi:transposase-like protein